MTGRRIAVMDLFLDALGRLRVDERRARVLGRRPVTVGNDDSGLDTTDEKGC